MAKKEYHYICSNINSLATIPVRLYNGNNLEKLFSVIDLAKDPATLHMDKLLCTKNHIEYIFIDSSQIYGVIKHNNYRVVIGPIGSFLEDISQIEKTAFHLGFYTKEEIAAFATNLSLIPNMPLYSFLQMLCTVNFYLNDEMLSIKDITITDDFQEGFSLSIQEKDATERAEEIISDSTAKHNFLAFERTMLYFVEKGQVDKLKQFFEEALPGAVGKIAIDHLRNTKNIFITTATLVSRAAIRGGLEQDTSFTMSDNYIQRAELLYNTDAILNLQYHMVLDYAERVAQLKADKSLSKLVVDAISYIRKNLIRIKTTEEVASAVYTSRSYLGSIFKKETGATLAEYLTQEKIEEAKRLLRFTDKPLVAISNYLGFSSQSHFQNTFKKLENCTPNEFRQRYSKH